MSHWFSLVNIFEHWQIQDLFRLFSSQMSQDKELDIKQVRNNNGHCVKSVRIRSYSGLHFSAYGLNSERYSVYSVSLHIQSEQGKMRTKVTPNTAAFNAVGSPILTVTLYGKHSNETRKDETRQLYTQKRPKQSSLGIIKVALKMKRQSSVLPFECLSSHKMSEIYTAMILENYSIFAILGPKTSHFLTSHFNPFLMPAIRQNFPNT